MSGEGSAVSGKAGTRLVVSAKRLAAEAIAPLSSLGVGNDVWPDGGCGGQW